MATELVPAGHAHVVDEWRDATASALEAQVLAINDGLTALTDLETLFEVRSEERVCSEIRQLAGLLRERAQTIIGSAGSIRALR